MVRFRTATTQAVARLVSLLGKRGLAMAFSFLPWSSCALRRQFRHSRTASTVCAFLPCTASRIPAEDPWSFGHLLRWFTRVVQQVLPLVSFLVAEPKYRRRFLEEFLGFVRITADYGASKPRVKKLRCCCIMNSTVFNSPNGPVDSKRPISPNLQSLLVWLEDSKA